MPKKNRKRACLMKRLMKKFDLTKITVTSSGYVLRFDPKQS